VDSAFIVPAHTQGAQVRITQFYLQITPYVLPLPRKHSPDGAATDWCGTHLTAAYYSFIDPKGWKSKLAWLTDLPRTVYPHKWSPKISCRWSAGYGKFTDQRPTFCHCAMQQTEGIQRHVCRANSRLLVHF